MSDNPVPGGVVPYYIPIPMEETSCTESKAFLRSFIKRIVIRGEKTVIQYNLPRTPDGTSGLDALKALIDAVEAKLSKLADENTVSGSVTGNWNSGTATSGETGADLVSIGANNTKKKLHSLLINIGLLQAGAKVTVKMFMQVNGTERKVYKEEFTKGIDPDGLWIVNGTVGIHEVLRVEATSNKAADNGAAIEYDYMLEAM
ncbi:hypothetical protein ACFLXU_02025 [Chloroflexota bacterium]